MNELHKIAYNCRKATFLIEKQQLSSITLREKLELKIHLAGCSVCKLFQKQSALINQSMRGLFQNRTQQEMHLDDEFKAQLQHQIDERFNNQRNS